jgi:ubiquinone/menaquinone biosynthesis C-methylase UbiE
MMGKINTINFDSIADLYDSYVTTQYDIPFFLKEAEDTQGSILELMCGTGRVSIHLLKNGINLTCIDYSEDMLKVFRSKIKGKNYNVNLIKMDVSELSLKNKFGLIFIPFHSFSEILSEEKQKQALNRISQHLDNKGKFICTLHNPDIRIKSADGILKLLGKFPIEKENLLVYYLNKYNSSKKIITGFQLYEIYDSNNNLKEKRILEINFKIIDKNAFEKMIEETGFRILKIYGDYNYSEFDDENSSYIIFVLQKNN